MIKYITKEDNGRIGVIDTSTGKWMTKEDLNITIEIASEIADDFNAMENKDFRSIGLPDFSEGKS